MIPTSKYIILKNFVPNVMQFSPMLSCLFKFLCYTAIAHSNINTHFTVR